MHIFNSILLGSLLVSSFVHNSPMIGHRTNNSQQFNWQQQRFAQSVDSESECPISGKGPLPGCGRRDT